ncbi:MAG: hypothetical protein CML17_08080 [Pusillimonas sp.]|nr:hypothetical protein [Pusillimonas sp.]
MALADDLAKAIAKVLEGKDLGGQAKVTKEEGEDDAKFEERKQKALTNLKIEQDKLDALRQTKLDIQDIELESLRIDRQRLEIQKESLKPEDYAQRLKDIQAQEAGLNAGADAARRFLGVTGQQNSMLAQLAVGGEKYRESIVKGFKGAVSGANIATAAIDKVVEASIALAMAQDAAAVSFAKSTGQGVDFTDNIISLERNLYQAGVTSDEAGRAVQSLFMNVTDFTEMSEKQQAVLGQNVALLQELGVSSETAAKNIQFSTKVLGMSVNQSARLQRELLTFAQDLGVSADQIASDFASMGPQIAALGADGVDAFRRLEVQSKNTGLALNEIVGIVEKFNKFDTAAQSVGRLNALLGGPYLNTLELVAETDPSKRFEILKNRVDAAGLSFDTMDFYQRKALASAMGLNEQQLALMMRGRLDLIQEPQKSAADIEALAEQTAQFNTLMEELGQIAMSFAISFGPLISGLKDFIQFIQPAIPFVIGFGIAFAAYATPIGQMATIFGVVTGAVIALQGALGDLYHFFFVGNSPSFLDVLGLVSESMSGLTGVFASLPSVEIPGVTASVENTVKASTAVVSQGQSNATTALNNATATAAALTPNDAPAAAPQQVQGPPPVINITLQVDGTEFAAVVNDVSVEKYSGGKPSEMYASIISMIEQGFVRGV